MNIKKANVAVPANSLISRLALYFRYTKPRVWVLLVYTAAIGGIMAVSILDIQSIMLVMLAIAATALGSAGSEALTNFIDRDMDSLMSRTKNRPLPSGEIELRRAVILGFTLVSGSILILVVFQKFYAAAFMAVGIFDNVFVYSYLLKRKTPWSIVLGGFSGGFPVVIGWYTVTAQFSLLPWFLFALVVIWIPIHVWSLAFRYRDDYRNAKVPMLPVLYSDRVSAWCISGSAIMLAVFSVIPFIFGFQTLYYLLIVLILTVPMFMFSLAFVKHPDLRSSFRLFKYTSPYLAVIFTLFFVFKVL
ncbi:MAG: heme o synthase [Candidatus Thermoplasmatota archaeon]|nr:heme o synthase [Candidatus Thermoplasmatota archaeon]